ncbi:TlpA family protein disulfide reductase [Parafilimonas terrae]|uniref:Thiol-disulfide isomerase or thioredoxin n=1 Tax=Parafilimonas terrae TaxID=1465490 RepID=A0A1I5VIQ9_9BACT|nr:TlpA disulfide reductase family protein [Parafilimonas terrae]SFQ07343.1 Thiol-disulfide isomerase or thioredoxin [Parafilimonas terrae]
MKTTVFAVLLVLCLYGRAQRPLSVNDRLPLTELKSLDGTTLHLSGQQHLLLDFFSIYCGGCIAALPHLNELQQQYGADLRVILVAREAPAAVSAFFRNNKTAKSNRLPVTAADRVLESLFPHSLVPHEVWIDTALRVRAITAGEAVTAANVEAFITGRLASLPVKQDIEGFDYEAPFAVQPQLEKAMLWESRFGGGVSGIGHSTGINTVDNRVRLFAVNLSAVTLYGVALQAFIGNSRLPQPSLSFLDAQYCYELTAPAGTPPAMLKQYMKQDLDRAFNGSGCIRDTVMPCYVLRQTAGGHAPAQQGRQARLQDWTAHLNSLPGMPLIVEDSALAATSFNLPVIQQAAGVQEINEALAPFGFRLEAALRPLPVFVFIPNTNKKQL